MEKQLINSKFWGEYSKLYDRITPSFQRELLEYVGSFSQGNILDCGCGTGKLIPNLSKNTLSYTGLEFVDEMIELAKNKTNGNDFSREFQQGNFNEITSYFGGKKFDCIYFLNSLYPNTNPIEVLKNIRSKLDCGGYLIISDQRRDVKKKDLANKIFEEFKDDVDLSRFFEMNEVLIEKSIPRSYSLEEATSIMGLLGFKVLESRDSDFLDSSYTLISQKLE